MSNLPGHLAAEILNATRHQPLRVTSPQDMHDEVEKLTDALNSASNYLGRLREFIDAEAKADRVALAHLIEDEMGTFRTYVDAARARISDAADALTDAQEITADMYVPATTEEPSHA